METVDDGTAPSRCTEGVSSCRSGTCPACGTCSRHGVPKSESYAECKHSLHARTLAGLANDSTRPDIRTTQTPINYSLDAGRDLFEQQLREHEKNEDDETALSRLQGPEFLQSLAAELKTPLFCNEKARLRFQDGRELDDYNMCRQETFSRHIKELILCILQKANLPDPAGFARELFGGEGDALQAAVFVGCLDLYRATCDGPSTTEKKTCEAALLGALNTALFTTLQDIHGLDILDREFNKAKVTFEELLAHGTVSPSSRIRYDRAQVEHVVQFILSKTGCVSWGTKKIVVPDKEGHPNVVEIPALIRELTLTDMWAAYEAFCRQADRPVA